MNRGIVVGSDVRITHLAFLDGALDGMRALVVSIDKHGNAFITNAVIALSHPKGMRIKLKDIELFVPKPGEVQVVGAAGPGGGTSPYLASYFKQLDEEEAEEEEDCGSSCDGDSWETMSEEEAAQLDPDEVQACMAATTAKLEAYKQQSAEVRDQCTRFQSRLDEAREGVWRLQQDSDGQLAKLLAGDNKGEYQWSCSISLRAASKPEGLIHIPYFVFIPVLTFFTVCPLLFCRGLGCFPRRPVSRGRFTLVGNWGEAGVAVTEPAAGQL